MSFPLLGRVTAGGMTLRNFESELKKRLADGYRVDPQVSVAVEQHRSRRLYVVGEVRTPGPVPLTGDMTLIEALARAGSTLPSASGELAIVRGKQGADGPTPPSDGGDDASIVRAAIRDLESGTMKQAIELRDGDTIFVLRAETAFVFGEVRSPGSFPIQKDTTVLQALSLAGGVTEHGALNRVCRPAGQGPADRGQGGAHRHRPARRHYRRAGEALLTPSTDLPKIQLPTTSTSNSQNPNFQRANASREPRVGSWNW